MFDSGTLFFMPQDGDLTPVRVGGLQNIELDMDFDVRPVRGQLQYPLKFTTGLNGLKAKAKMAMVDGDLLFRVAYGGQGVPGSRQVKLDQVFTVPSAPPYQVLVVPPLVGSDFAFDLGVAIVIGGTVLRRVAAGPVGYEYSVPGPPYPFLGPKYTFGPSLAGVEVRISFAFDALNGKKLVLQNQPMWLAPTMAVMLFQKFKCGTVSFWLPSVVSEKMLWPTRLEEYTIPDLEFQVQQDSSGEVGTFSVVE